MDVKKNRYDGYLGRILLQFNENNHSFSQVSEVIPYHRTGGGYAGANNNYNNNNTSNDNNYENAEGKVVNTTNALGKKIATPARLLWEQAMLKREQSKTVEAVPITNEATQTVSLSNTVEVSMVALEVKSATSNESKEITSVEPPVAPKKRTRKSSTKSNI